VEAEFSLAGTGLGALFEGLDVDYADITVVRRVVNAAGKNRIFVNDLPVPLAALREIGAHLIDIHSQHQALLLGNPKFQIDLIDSVAGEAELVGRYTEVYDAWHRAQREWEELRRTTEERGKEEDYLRFQYQQLTEAQLQAGEQDELETLQNELNHAAEIQEALSLSEDYLNADETGVLSRLKTVGSQLARLAPFFPKAGELENRIRTLREELKDAASEVSAQAERVEVDPEKLEKTEHRLDLLYSLQQKHRVANLGELIALRQEMADRLSGIEHADQELERAARQTELLHAEAVQLADKLGDTRRKAVPAIEAAVCDICMQLGMPNVRFAVEITRTETLTPSGNDRIAFLFSANKNREPEPVEKIASGGEMSRLMLSIKSLVTRHRKLPAIIFDEIDTGVSGEIADRMGRIILDLSQYMQVINITHLPQVAGKGEYHYKVFKEDDEKATNTRILRLTADQRVEEIARMLSGAEVTAAAIEQAKALLG
jgi:DNA repair protein RecN (Recombination protein N)